MKKFNFSLGMNGANAEVYVSDETGLCIKVTEKEDYVLYFKDGVFINRTYSDGCAYQNGLDFCKAFYENAAMRIDGNILEIATPPLNEKTKNTVDDILITNRFTFSKESAAIIQETFYTLKKKRYDTCPVIGLADVKENSFTTACDKSGDIVAKIEDLPRKIALEGEMVLKNDKKCLKINGGFVHLENMTVNSHIYTICYNDDLSYYNADNPIFTTYTFSDTPFEKKPKVKRNAFEAKNALNINSGKLTVPVICGKKRLAFWDGIQERAICAMLLCNVVTGKEIFVDTLSVWEEVKMISGENTVEFVLANPDCEGLRGITLLICAHLIKDENKIEWSVEVKNTSSEYSLIWCTYPRMYITGKDKLDLFVPEHGGTVRKSFNATDNYDGGAYPSGFKYPMPYYALYRHSGIRDNSIYYSVHDKSGALKDLYAASTQNGDVRLSCRYHAENIGKSANSQKLPGKAVWQIFNGDWFDATKIYKEFVHTECDWYTDKREKQTPQWMQEIPFWIMDWVPYDPKSGHVIPSDVRSENSGDKDDWYKIPIKLREELGVPIGYHIYNWHKIPFDSDYPHFMPAKEKFLDALPKLKESGIRVMPYINALLWDNQDREDENYEFEELGRPGAVKKENGEPVILTYESKKKNGDSVELSPICPSYRLWRDKLTELTTKMFKELDVDAIYLDQVAARVPHLCMDKSHSHPTGGGGWWQKNYRELLSQLNSAKPKDKVFTTEANAEVYSNSVDGFLSWMWGGSICDVPAFMSIYGTKVCVFGRNTYGAVKKNDLAWKYNLAKELVFGQQLGWINPDFTYNAKRLEFVKKLVNFRYKNKEFFKYCEIMRPPVIKAAKEHSFYNILTMFHIGFLHSPYIVGGTLKNGDKKKLILVNICDRPLKDIVEWNESEYNLSKAKYTVCGNGKIEITGNNSMVCSIEAESFISIEW